MWIRPSREASDCRLREGASHHFLHRNNSRTLLAGLPEKVRVMILLVMMTSMRVCEILALRWRRVDLRTGTLRITERFYRGDFSSVKSKQSDPDLPLGSVALETLTKWRSKSKGQRKATKHHPIWEQLGRNWAVDDAD